MNDNYKPIRQITDNLLQEYYQSIEKDLEEIINAPSLLARLSKYYQLYQEPIAPNHECYLIFVYNNEIWFIKEWNINKFQDYIRFKQQVELWCQVGLEIIPPEPIMYMGGLQK